MPLLDVSEVILSLEFQDAMTYTRNTQVIGSDGMAVDTPVTLPLYGVITSDKGDILNRIDVGARVEGTILIHTLTKLRMNGAGYDADTITWDGASYVVKNVNNYSRYGQGFICATCSILPLSGGN